VISVKSDWLYPSYQSQEIVRLLKKRHMITTYSTYGHDAFLIEIEEQTRLIRNFLSNLGQGR
jgi:homoserine O-acetyltransferase